MLPAKTVLALAVLTPLAFYTVRLITNLLASDRDIPGPFWARITKLWYLRQMIKGDFHETNIELHRKKGSIIRVAPNHYSLNDPECLKTVYGLGSKYIKSTWYDGWNMRDDTTLTSLFTERDPKRHAANRRKVANMYTMTAMTAYEPFVDSCIDLLRKQLDRASSSLSVFDLGHWSQCYAFDVIGEITFGERFGFLDQMLDVNNIIATLDTGLGASSYIGLYIWLRPYFIKALRIAGSLTNDALLVFVTRHINTGNAEKMLSGSDTIESHSPMLQKFLQARAANPDHFREWDVMTNVLSNIGAGSDTTGLSLSAVFYYVYTNPGVLQKLREELEAADLSDPPTFKEAQRLPYFQAVIKEALRMHPGTGFPIFREVPEGGAVISGHYFPHKANVGVNCWVIHRDKEVYGADADVFRPERWLEASEDRRKLMERSYIAFGLGSRTCIGKNISLLEMNKLLPVVIRNYDVEILDKDRSLQSCNRWFVKPVNFMVRVHKRASVSAKDK
ncbi:cytochrome P450 [Aspergillus homomorphus CBS 101889]|uniref:Cytochrome P450 n=1 Tax=Aspergillus homomorphus (strain CBS 101889) TaxID=1450537 RepID=A0A395IBR1_ASPHC|nr:cytochrome P450 [Aspergillus homomorphus CBS 101889]RAL17642.1 cytochrome P450 [Aspergillus homomorphus CBS 101889]